MQYIPKQTNICNTFQYTQIPINTYNTYYTYNTSKYISICTNTDHDMQYMPVHRNMCNTCWYPYVHSNADQYLSIQTLHIICTIHTNTSKYRPLHSIHINKGCLVQVGNGIELEAVGFRFEPYRWRPCGVTWDSSRTVVVIKLRRTSALNTSIHIDTYQYRQIPINPYNIYHTYYTC